MSIFLCCNNVPKHLHRPIFKHTVYGLRFLIKSEGLPYSYLHLPEIKQDKKLPVVLSKEEVWAMLKSCTLLKHKILIEMYGIQKYSIGRFGF